MQFNASVRGRHQQQHQARTRAMVRFNGVMFYGVAAASFLEAAASLHANRLAHVLAGCPELGRWLEQVWYPERAGHGRALRDYLAAIWPEFDWDDAYQEFYDAYRPRYGYDTRRRAAALELLGLCANETQAAVFYRGLAHGADDPALRELAYRAGQDHVRYFDCFRQWFECCRRRERVGFGTTWRVLLQCSRAARDREVALAFQTLDRHWSAQKAFTELGYGEFLRRMGTVIRHHAALGAVERLLFRSWLRSSSLTAAAAGAEGDGAQWSAPALRLGAGPA